MKELIEGVNVLAEKELERANAKFALFRNKHEAIGVLDEEVYEMNEELKRVSAQNEHLHKAVYLDWSLEDTLAAMEFRMKSAIAEAVQVLAMIKKFKISLEETEREVK